MNYLKLYDITINRLSQYLTTGIISHQLKAYFNRNEQFFDNNYQLEGNDFRDSTFDDYRGIVTLYVLCLESFLIVFIAEFLFSIFLNKNIKKKCNEFILFVICGFVKIFQKMFFEEPLKFVFLFISRNRSWRDGGWIHPLKISGETILPLDTFI